jgi:hypothetical protein
MPVWITYRYSANYFDVKEIHLYSFLPCFYSLTPMLYGTDSTTGKMVTADLGSQLSYNCASNGAHLSLISL